MMLLCPQSAAMPPFSSVPVLITLHALSTRCRLQTMCHCNEHKILSAFSSDRAVHNCKIIRQRVNTGEWNTLSATSAQFTTAKTQGCTNVLSNSRHQNVCGEDGRYPGLQFKICKLHNNWECASSTQEKFCFFMWLLYVELLEGQNRYELVCAVMINPPELPIYDEARNEAHIASTGVRRY